MLLEPSCFEIQSPCFKIQSPCFVIEDFRPRRTCPKRTRPDEVVGGNKGEVVFAKYAYRRRVSRSYKDLFEIISSLALGAMPQGHRCPRNTQNIGIAGGYSRRYPL